MKKYHWFWLVFAVCKCFLLAAEFHRQIAVFDPLHIIVRLDMSDVFLSTLFGVALIAYKVRRIQIK